jgi:hypothetical protein
MTLTSSGGFEESAVLSISAPMVDSFRVADSDWQMASGKLPASIQSSLIVVSSAFPQSPQCSTSFRFSATSGLVPVATTEIRGFRETGNFSSVSQTILGNHMILWVLGILVLLLVGAAVLVWFYLHRSEEESNWSDTANPMVQEESNMFNEGAGFAEQENPLSAVGFRKDVAALCFEPSVPE